MKYMLIVGDGMADEKIEALGGKTPLEYVAGANMARVAGGELGRIRTCPTVFSPGSDVAFLTLLGHDPVKCYRGRSPLEAAGEDVLALGSDYDGCDVPSWLDPCDQAGGLHALIASRFGEAGADKAFFGNARAFFERLEGQV